MVAKSQAGTGGLKCQFSRKNRVPCYFFTSLAMMCLKNVVYYAILFIVRFSKKSGQIKARANSAGKDFFSHSASYESSRTENFHSSILWYLLKNWKYLEWHFLYWTEQNVILIFTPVNTTTFFTQFDNKIDQYICSNYRSTDCEQVSK